LKSVYRFDFHTGCGKTAIARAFASAFGYSRRGGGGAGGVYPVFCFKDMSARDLTQRRTTDALGNTVWSDGPLVAAARRGGLCVLDGAHRLARGTLCGAVAPLLCDRSLALPSGERLVAREHYDDLISRGFSEDALRAARVAPAHPSFRVLATAEPGGDWLDDEVLTVFHFHGVDPLDRREHAALLRGEVEARGGDADACAPLLEAALDFGDAVGGALDADPTLAPLLLSTRRLLALATHAAALRGDAAAVLHRALSPGFALLPPLGQETASRLLGAALRARGFTAFDDAAVLHLLRGDDDAARAAAAARRDVVRHRGRRLCGNQPLVWGPPTKLQNSPSRSNRSRFG